MRTLSIRQPWAWLIVNGHKDIENRDWETFWRGPVLVHAGKTMAKRYHAEVAAWVQGEFGITVPAFDELPRGGIVGVMTITGCVRQSKSRWFNDGGFGFVLSAARTLPQAPSAPAPRPPCLCPRRPCSVPARCARIGRRNWSA